MNLSPNPAVMPYEIPTIINGHFRILKWKYGSSIFQAIFSRDIMVPTNIWYRIWGFFFWFLHDVSDVFFMRFPETQTSHQEILFQIQDQDDQDLHSDGHRSRIHMLGEPIIYIHIYIYI